MKAIYRIFFTAGFSILFCLTTSIFAAEVYLPHVTGGADNWKDYLQVDNNKLITASFTLTLYSDGESVYEGSFDVPGLGESVIKLKELSTTAQCGKIKYSDSGLNFRLSYENTTSGGIAEFKLTDTANSALGFYFSDFSTAITAKSLAIANLNSTIAKGKLYAIGEGSILGTADLNNIDPYSKISGSHNSWFPNIALSRIKKIIVISTGTSLCGITINSNTDSSLLVFTTADPVTDFNTGVPQQTDHTGTWAGTWHSTTYPPTSGGLMLYLVQTENIYSGTMDLTNTDCGDVSGVPISGVISANTFTANASYDCQGNLAELVLTNGVFIGDIMNGIYRENVNGQFYDSGTFTTTKQ